MNWSKIMLFCWVFLNGAIAQGQDIHPKSAQHYLAYPFIDVSANRLINKQYLEPFYFKLTQLKNGERDKVTILHIGDSHIQADLWTGKLRRLFQQYFGSAGRGLFFPFQLIGSHNPLDISTHTNATWEGHTSAFRDGPPMGVCGAGMRTKQSDFYIDIIVKDSLPTDKFNQVTLFNQKGASAYNYILGKGDVKKIDVDRVPVKPRYHRVRSGNTLWGISRKYHVSVRQLQRWNNMRGSRLKIGRRLIVSKPRYKKAKTPDFEKFAYLANMEYPDSIYRATLVLDRPVNQLVIKGDKLTPDQKECVFYGCLLENTLQKGILYDAVGVNGTTFYHYNHAKYFFDQIALLKPDLVIVSLGTNEALSSGFDADKFSEQVNTFFDHLSEELPEVPVIITSNGDALRKKKYTTPNNSAVRDRLAITASTRNYAYWDLNTIMGGEESIRDWQKSGLAGKDYIHLTKKGYQILGELLFDAVVE